MKPVRMGLRYRIFPVLGLGSLCLILSLSSCAAGEQTVAKRNAKKAALKDLDQEIKSGGGVTASSISLDLGSVNPAISLTSATVADLKISLVCDQVARMERILDNINVSIPVAVGATHCTFELLAFVLDGVAFIRTTAYTSLAAGGTAEFSSFSPAKKVLVRIVTGLPSPLGSTNFTKFVYDQSVGGTVTYAPNQSAVQGGLIGEGVDIPGFDLTFAAGGTSSGYTFTCLVPVQGTAGQTTCNGLALAGLKFALTTIGSDQQAPSISEVSKLITTASTVASLDPTYIAASEGGNGGVTVYAPNPPGAFSRSMSAILTNAQPTHSSSRHWEFRLNPDMFLLQGIDPLALGQLSHSSTTTYEVDNAVGHAGEKVFSTVGNFASLSIDYIPVDTTKTYRVSGEFRSAGSTPSILYYGVATYDVNKKHIGSEIVLRVGNELTIASLSDDSLPERSIITSEAAEGWFGAGSHAHQRSLGIYLDGDTSHAPDYVEYNFVGNDSSSTLSTEGMFSSTSATDRSILLNRPLLPAIVQSIVFGTTKVRNHTFGGTYLYAAAGGTLAPNEWTLYSANITGEGLGGQITKFRIGTKFIRIMILQNYRQDATAKLNYTNLKFETVQ